MGLLRFLVSPPDRVSAQAAERAYLVGREQIPWVSRVQLSSDYLSLARSESESACLCIPWQVAGRGEVMLSTATLMERFQPYHLAVELARGKVQQLRTQVADWQAVGLEAKEPQQAGLRDALAHLSRAVTLQHAPLEAAEHADRAIRAALEVGDSLGQRYVDKIMLARHRQAPHLATWLGANLGHRLLNAEISRQFLQTFNAANVPLVWRDVEAQEGSYRWDVHDRQTEWCLEHGLKVMAGPLLQFDDRGLPDWLALWQGDFDNILSFVSDYVETAVHRYRGKVHLWRCAARVNTGRVLSLSEEDRLRLAVRAFEITRKIDPATPAIICFDQPWAEYMGHTECDLSPLHFADVLVRSGLELSGLGLEFNVGYWPGGSSTRDCLEFSRLLDRWSGLGLPLWLTLTVPAGQADDSRAFGRARPVETAYPGGWSPQTQQQWMRELLPLLLAKPAVAGILYNHLSDAHRHEFPHSGLFDRAGLAKPALATLAKLRRKHLA